MKIQSVGIELLKPFIIMNNFWCRFLSVFNLKILWIWLTRKNLIIAKLKGWKFEGKTRKVSSNMKDSSRRKVRIALEFRRRKA